MRFLAAVFVLVLSPALTQAETGVPVSAMSPVGCNALSDSAAAAAARLRDSVGLIEGTAFHEAMPLMPESARDEAADAEAARVGMESAMREYMISLDAFSRAIRDCGN